MSKSSSLIELIDQELVTKTGFFLNPKTGSVWELSIQDGELILKVPRYIFQISPSSKSIFRPVNTLINLEIEFEKSNMFDFLHMHIYAKGIKRATFFLV
ncbi:hypothetical protein [Chlorogloea sp. CCALA 695]|uniref:hypothetical protein n=1 Tax=Chlorogloea sp. CCALA 695 TaxID=2107693 RepID=UPI000D065918|nr:hypothetical protein C7B70_13870 [Chlorogloea sp. CCALA 695]